MAECTIKISSLTLVLIPWALGTLPLEVYRRIADYVDLSLETNNFECACSCERKFMM
jgi:hypothetical protein